jgi:hypothetical protein
MSEYDQLPPDYETLPPPTNPPATLEPPASSPSQEPLIPRNLVRPIAIALIVIGVPMLVCPGPGALAILTGVVLLVMSNRKSDSGGL